MTTKPARAYRAFLVTVSSSRARSLAGGESLAVEDRTGQRLQVAIEELGGEVVGRALVADSVAEIQAEAHRASKLAEVVVFAGGTGVAPSDVTPEALSAVFERELPGFGELMRARGAENPKVRARAYLSRSLAGVLGRALILGVPGSPGGAIDSYEAVAPLLAHVVDLLAGDVGSCQDELPSTD